MSDPRIPSADPRLLMADPRTSIPDPRVHHSDPRSPLPACNCGLPNCPRLGPQGVGISHESQYAAAHGLGISIGASPVGGIDPAVLYSMSAAYGMKESPELMRTLPQMNGYYPYDPAAVYPYMNGYMGIDARRKNATKESTNTLKAWLFEHRKNPYPTKGEKIMLAILTRMTLTQVSTWFANARRRLKKDHKLTWTSKDDIDVDDIDDDVTSEHNSEMADRANISGNSGDDHHNGSVDDDDVLSITSDGDRSEIDVGDNSDLGDEEHRLLAIAQLNHNELLRQGLPRQTTCTSVMTSPNVCTTSSNHADQAARSDQDATSANESSQDPQVSHEASLRRPPSATPPPSPSDTASTSASPLTSSLSHQSSSTIHHLPTVSSSSNTLKTSAHAPPTSSSTSSPTKAKIWSIADVVSSKNSDKSPVPQTELPKLSSSSSQNATHSIGGGLRLDAPMVRPQSIPGMIMPGGSDNPYGLSYYPYGLHHPVATAMMASQASHMVGARIPHPYSRLPAPHSRFMGYPDVRPMGFQRDLGMMRPHPQESGMRPGEPRGILGRREDENKNESPISKCTPTAFKPVVQRQV